MSNMMLQKLHLPTCKCLSHNITTGNCTSMYIMYLACWRPSGHHGDDQIWSQTGDLEPNWRLKVFWINKQSQDCQYI